MNADGNSPTIGKRASTGLYLRAKPGLRLRDKTVERLARKMRAVMPWLEPSDMPACRAWAEMEYLAGKVYAVLQAGGVFNQKGETRRLLDDYRKLRQTQIVLSGELGMTPTVRMALKVSGTRAALDLAAMMAKGEGDESESP